MTSSTYAKLTTGLIAVWFALSVYGSAVGWFNAAGDRPPLALLLSLVVPLTLWIGWYAMSSSFREFALGLDPKTLTMLQAWRIAGFVFLVMYAYRMLPGAFALPAGWGDVVIGASAVFVATRWVEPQHRTAFIVWQFLGITDLVVAVGSGALGRFLAPERFLEPTGISTASMTALPLSLIPTFGVPLFLLVHFLSIAQARRWPRHASATVSAQALRSAI